MVRLALLAAGSGDLGRDVARLVGALLALVLVPVVLTVVAAAMYVAAPYVAVRGSATAGGSLPPEPPAAHLALMVEVGDATGVPWSLLAAIASVESGFGANMATSWAGAVGYGQFMPPSWEAFGEGGDPYDYRDVVPAMARYLLAAGVLQDLPQAVYAYNHSWEYVALVLGRMAYYQAAYAAEATAPAGRGTP